MKILIDIGHPAHVHLFKHFAWDMQNKGHKIFFTCREKEFEVYLLNKCGFSFKSFGRKYYSIAGKLLGLIEFGIKEFIAGLRFKPDIFLSHGSMYAAHAAFLLRKPNIALEDTFNFEQLRLSMPFSQVILTGDHDHPLKSRKVIRYSGNHELAYLHPNRFQPAADAAGLLGLGNGEPFVIMRFVSWKASHDIGLSGFTDTNKILAVKEFSKYARVFISSEKDLPPALEPYKIQIPPEKIHDVLANAALFFGESATMASESAVLGTPAIYLNEKWFGNTNEETSIGLLFSFRSCLRDQEKAIAKGVELLAGPDSHMIMKKKRQAFLEKKIDVTAFMVWFIEKYPESFGIMRKNPDYQYRFK